MSESFAELRPRAVRALRNAASITRIIGLAAAASADDARQRSLARSIDWTASRLEAHARAFKRMATAKLAPPKRAQRHDG